MLVGVRAGITVLDVEKIEDAGVGSTVSKEVWLDLREPASSAAAVVVSTLYGRSAPLSCFEWVSGGISELSALSSICIGFVSWERCQGMRMMINFWLKSCTIKKLERFDISLILIENRRKNLARSRSE